LHNMQIGNSHFSKNNISRYFRFTQYIYNFSTMRHIANNA
jgi:hypothetical protein